MWYRIHRTPNFERVQKSKTNSRVTNTRPSGLFRWHCWLVPGGYAISTSFTDKLLNIANQIHSSWWTWEGLTKKKRLLTIPSFSAMTFFALSICSGVPRMMKVFSLGLGWFLRSISQWAPVCWLICLIVSPPLQQQKITFDELPWLFKMKARRNTWSTKMVKIKRREEDIFHLTAELHPLPDVSKFSLIFLNCGNPLFFSTGGTRTQTCYFQRLSSCLLIFYLIPWTTTNSWLLGIKVTFPVIKISSNICNFEERR